MGKASRRRLLGEDYIEDATARDGPSALDLKKDREQKNTLKSLKLDQKKFWENLGFTVDPDGTIRDPNHHLNKPQNPVQKT